MCPLEVPACCRNKRDRISHVVSREVAGAALCRIPRKVFFPLVTQVGSCIYRRLVWGQTLAIKLVLGCLILSLQAEKTRYKLSITCLVPPFCIFPSPFSLGFLRTSQGFHQAWANFVDWCFSCSWREQQHAFADQKATLLWQLRGGLRKLLLIVLFQDRLQKQCSSSIPMKQSSVVSSLVWAQSRNEIERTTEPYWFIFSIIV